VSSSLTTGTTALTIYNQNFAVVRDTVPLDLQAGVNTVRYAGATAQVEPDSVILRDPAGKHSLQILEQNYRNDPVSQELLLSLFEGKTIDFEKRRMKDNTQSGRIIPGKIVRSGYVPGGEAQQPIIEVDGKLQFSLPGSRAFPTSATTRCSSPRSTGCCNPTSPANSTPRSATSPADLTGARATISSRRKKATSWIWSAGSR
jgi:hypothetical protein